MEYLDFCTILRLIYYRFAQLSSFHLVILNFNNNKFFNLILKLIKLRVYEIINNINKPRQMVVPVHDGSETFLERFIIVPPRGVGQVLESCSKNG